MIAGQKIYGNKLRTYRTFKDNFCGVFEKYLEDSNFTERNLLTKLRISSHHLEQN